MWTLEFSRDAAKVLIRMPRDQSRLIRRRLDELARDPFASPNVRKLTQHPGYRLRVGDWRVVYLLVEDRIVIHVIRIAPRDRAYR